MAHVEDYNFILLDGIEDQVLRISSDRQHSYMLTIFDGAHFRKISDQSDRMIDLRKDACGSARVVGVNIRKDFLDFGERNLGMPEPSRASGMIENGRNRRI
jgi:hypothetical protein